MNKIENKKPLVSIVVVTYNSSQYVLETLESAKAQTYRNIELIVTDDCSTDNTVEVCRDWMEENKERFVRTELITVEKNTGISPNCNRGYNAANGEWIKGIAGDDILLENCIDSGVNFLREGTKVFASKAIIFSINYKSDGILCETNNEPFFDENITAYRQLKLMVKRNRIMAPTVFISKQFWQENNGFDEEIKYLEDYPFWLKILRRGIKIDFLNQFTVAYRRHANSISGYDKNKLFYSFFKKEYQFRKEYLKQDLNFLERVSSSYQYRIMCIFESLNLNNKKFNIPFRILLKMNPTNLLLKNSQ